VTQQESPSLQFSMQRPQGIRKGRQQVNPSRPHGSTVPRSCRRTDQGGALRCEISFAQNCLAVVVAAGSTSTRSPAHVCQKRRSDYGEARRSRTGKPTQPQHKEVRVGSEAGQDVNRPPSSTTKGSEAKASTSCILTLFHKAGIATSSVPASLIRNTNPAVREGSQTIGSLRSITGQLCWLISCEGRSLVQPSFMSRRQSGCLMGNTIS